MRGTLKRLLETEADLEVIAAATDVETARGLLRTHRPHVLVLDLRMPDGSIMDTIRHLRAEAHATEFIVVTMDDTQIIVDQVLGAGVSELVLKDTADTELADAVRRAAASGRGHPRAGVS
jgi:DNA-binding NarL/FixJ family response regulator